MNETPIGLTLAHVHGTTPDKWCTRFAEWTPWGKVRGFATADPVGPLCAGEADMALVRLPEPMVDHDPADRFHVVCLYEEEPGLGVPVDSELTLLDDVTAADVAEYAGGGVLYQPDEETGVVDVQAVFAAAQVVAANVGVVVAPRPLLRGLSDKLIADKAYSDGTVTTIALVWLKDRDCERYQDFVGICRGRGSRSSRTAETIKKEPGGKPLRKRVVPKVKGDRRRSKTPRKDRGKRR